MTDFIYFALLVSMIFFVLIMLILLRRSRRMRIAHRSHPLDADFIAEHTKGSFQPQVQTKASRSSTSHERLEPSPFEDDQTESDSNIPPSNIQKKCQRIAQKRRVGRQHTRRSSPLEHEH